MSVSKVNMSGELLDEMEILTFSVANPACTLVERCIPDDKVMSSVERAKAGGDFS